MPREPSLPLKLSCLPSALAALCCVAACGAPAPRVANPTRALDERRAVEIIADVFRQEKEQPAPGADMALSARHRLHVDVTASGKRIGVAYVTGAERSELEGALPPRDAAMGDALQLVSGVDADRDARVCVLYDADYLYDDTVGEARERSALTAELKLRRDVRDFLVIVHRGPLK